MSTVSTLELLNGMFGIDKKVESVERVQACAKAALHAIPGSYIQSDTDRCVNINIPSINSSIMFYTDLKAEEPTGASRPMDEAERRCYSEFQGMCCAFDVMVSRGADSDPDWTAIAYELAMSLGITAEDPVPLQVMTEVLFKHEFLRGHHKNLWKRMVNMITPEQRANAKAELKGYGWDL